MQWQVEGCFRVETVREALIGCRVLHFNKLLAGFALDPVAVLCTVLLR